jgi:hypothetical protein
VPVGGTATFNGVLDAKVSGTLTPVCIDQGTLTIFAQQLDANRAAVGQPVAVGHIPITNLRTPITAAIPVQYAAVATFTLTGQLDLPNRGGLSFPNIFPVIDQIVIAAIAAGGGGCAIGHLHGFDPVLALLVVCAVMIGARRVVRSRGAVIQASPHRLVSLARSCKRRRHAS